MPRAVVPVAVGLVVVPATSPPRDWHVAPQLASPTPPDVCSLMSAIHVVCTTHVVSNTHDLPNFVWLLRTLVVCMTTNVRHFTTRSESARRNGVTKQKTSDCLGARGVPHERVTGCWRSSGRLAQRPELCARAFGLADVREHGGAPAAWRRRVGDFISRSEPF